jgi:polypeptide N-acetylgalactosaminyltransferase
MWIPKRRYILRITICIPIVWFLIAIIILQSSDVKIDEQASQDETTDRRRELNIYPQNLINFVKNLINYQSESEEVIALDIHDEKIDLNGPGEMGKPVEIDKNKLTPSERQKYDEAFKRNSFSEYTSDLISKHRSLPDVRDPGCRQIQYKAPPVTASIVMCFHNEAWSVLLRSIHSIIDRSPAHLLKEIILVDDFSDMSKKDFLFI